MIPLGSEAIVEVWRANHRKTARAASLRVMALGFVAAIPALLAVNWVKARWPWMDAMGPPDLPAAAAKWSAEQLTPWHFDPRAWALVWLAAWSVSGLLVWLAFRLLTLWGPRGELNGDGTLFVHIKAWNADQVPYPWAAALSSGEPAQGLCGLDSRPAPGLGSLVSLAWMAMCVTLMLPINFAIMSRLTGSISMPPIMSAVVAVSAGGVAFATIGAGRTVAGLMGAAGAVSVVFVMALAGPLPFVQPGNWCALLTVVLALGVVTLLLLLPRSPRVLLVTAQRWIFWRRVPSEWTRQRLERIRQKRQLRPELMTDTEWLETVRAAAPAPSTTLQRPVHLTLQRRAWCDLAVVTSAADPQPVRMRLAVADADALAELARAGGDTVDDFRQSRWYAKAPAYVIGLAIMLAAAWPLGRPVAVCMAGAEVLLPALGAANQGDGRILDTAWPIIAEKLPDEPVIWGMRAVTLHRLGRAEEAEAARQRAVELAHGEGSIGRLVLLPQER